MLPVAVQTEFVSRALTDRTNKALLCPTPIFPDMSLRHPKIIIQPDWLALLEGMILACPAPYITVAHGHCGNGEERVILVQLTSVI